MDQIRKNKFKKYFKETMGRDPKSNEEGNLETDWGLCVKVCLEEIDELKERISKLEK